MAALRDLLQWKVEVLFLLSLFPYLAASSANVPVGTKCMNGCFAGNLQIDKTAIPPEVLPCFTQPVLSAASNCPFKQSQWKDMHCRNNSFGMYTNQNRFINLGAQPLGVVFPSFFFNPPSLSGCSSGPSSYGEENKTQALLKSNAKATMSISLLEQTIKKLQQEKNELEQELHAVKQAELDQKGLIQVLKLRSERWEEGLQDCQTSGHEQRNTSNVALRLAQAHITQLKADNKLYAEASNSCSAELTSVQESLSIAENRAEQKELELTQCSVNLASSRKAEAAVRKTLIEEENEHSKDIDDYQEQLQLLASEKQEYQAAVASCNASLNELRSEHGQVKQYHEICLADVGRTSVQLDFCRKSLNACRGNHSMVAGLKSLREKDLEICRDEASRLNELLTICTNDAAVTLGSLNSSKANNEELTVQLVSTQNELKGAKFSLNELDKTVRSLEAKLMDERDAFNDADAQARTCSLDLETAKLSYEASRDKLEVLSEKLDDARKKFASLSKTKNKLKAALSSSSEKGLFWKRSADKCQKKLNEELSGFERLVQTESDCQKQLSNVSTSLSVIESQRDKCFNGNHINAQQIDDWRERFENMNEQLAAYHLMHANCSKLLQLMTYRFDAAEKEADEMQFLNVNLQDRLKTAVDAVSSTTKSNTQLRVTISNQKRENLELGKQLAGLQGTLDAEKNRNKDCEDKYSSSETEVERLGGELSKLTDESSKLQLNLDQCSQELSDSQTTLLNQTSMYADQAHSLRTAQAALQLAESLNSDAQAEMATLEHQLKYCRSNHSEMSSQSLVWEQQLILCQKTLTAKKTTCMREVANLDERLIKCRQALRRTEESLNKTMLSNAHCQKENKGLAAQVDQVNKKFQAAYVNINMLGRRLSTLKINANNLQRDSKTLKDRLETAKLQHGHTRDQLTRCRDAKENQQTQLYDMTQELEECHHLAHIHKAPSLGLLCPEVEQGSYVWTEHGCLLVTRSAGTQQEMATLCDKQGGGHLLSKAAISGLEDTLQNLLSAGKLMPAGVWLKTKRTGGPHCSSVSLNKDGDPLLPSSMDCGQPLQGLCLIDPHADISGQLTSSITTGMGGTSFETQSYQTSHSDTSSYDNSSSYFGSWPTGNGTSGSFEEMMGSYLGHM